MKRSETPIWKKSMLANLNLSDIRDSLWEISENGDCCGYDIDTDGYYQEYKDQFDELALGAGTLLEAMDDYELEDHWDDMTVALLGYRQTVLGFDSAEADYYHMADPYCEDWAVQEAVKRLERMTKDDLIRTYRKVMSILDMYWDLKAAHDCLVSIVEELDEHAAMFAAKNRQIDQLYTDLTGKSGEAFDALIQNLPQRMWVE